MAPDRNAQLALLDTPVFTKGPTRVPRARSSKPVVPASLPLRFEGPPLPPDALEAQRGLALARSQSLLRNRMLPRQAPAPPREAFEPAPDDSQGGTESLAGEPEERVFLLPRKYSASERNELLARIARLLEGVSRRAGAVDATCEGHAVQATLDARALRVAFTSRSARERWLPLLQALGRERGLIEPD
jgi:hypothetical protein